MSKLDVETRLERIVSVYEKLKEVLDLLPADISQEKKDKLAKMILGDAELRELIAGIKNRRPPRFIIIGRTGAGKSSLINALCGNYLAKTSDVKVGTSTACKYDYSFLGKIVFEIVDTCGFGESFATVVADKSLKDVVHQFAPDAILLLIKAKDRAFINQDAINLMNLNELSNANTPVIVVLTQVDELEPALEKDPKAYSDWKLNNISDASFQISNVLKENGIKYLDIISTSSLIAWDKNPATLPEEDWPNLRMSFDGRYGINLLLDLLEKNIDIKAGIHLMLTARADSIARKIATRLTNIFATISGAVGATPIPISDIVILTALQVILIMQIAYLSGKDLTYDTAKKLLASLAGVGIAGFSLRTIFQQGSKLSNLVYPGSGSFVSATIAAFGTRMIGTQAIAYFMDKSSKDLECNQE